MFNAERVSVTKMAVWRPSSRTFRKRFVWFMRPLRQGALELEESIQGVWYLTSPTECVARCNETSSPRTLEAINHTNSKPRRCNVQQTLSISSMKTIPVSSTAFTASLVTCAMSNRFSISMSSISGRASLICDTMSKG